MSLFDLVTELGHEEVLLVQDAVAGLRGVVAIHDTRRGPALAPTRLFPEASLEGAFADAVGLARAMTHETAFAGLPHGGASAVFVGDGAREKSRPWLQAYGRVLDRLSGRVQATADIGFEGRDLAVLSRISKHVAYRAGTRMDPAELAATSVVTCVREVAEILGLALDEMHVAVQGLGQVGYRVARALRTEGARLTVADLDPARVERAQLELGAAGVSAEEIDAIPCEVFSPNAASGQLTEASVGRLRCRAVVGAARGVLADARQADALRARQILYAPDFLVASGGTAGALLGDDDEMAIQEAVAAAGSRLAEILRRSRENGTSTERSALELMETRHR